MIYVLGIHLSPPTPVAMLRRPGTTAPRRLRFGGGGAPNVTGDPDAGVVGRVVARAIRATGSHPAHIVVAYPPEWDAERVARVEDALAAAGLPPATLFSAPSADARLSAEAIAEDAAAAALEELDERGGASVDDTGRSTLRGVWPRVVAVSVAGLLISAAAPATLIGSSTFIVAPSEQGDQGTWTSLAPGGSTDPELTTLPVDDDGPRPTTPGGAPGSTTPTTAPSGSPTPTPSTTAGPTDPEPSPDPEPEPDPDPSPDPDPTTDPEPSPDPEPPAPTE